MGALRLVGLTGLDDILARLRPRPPPLVEGKAGTGKTTLGMQFIRLAATGAKRFYITMSRRSTSCRPSRSAWWSLDGIEISELMPPDIAEGDDNRQTMFRARKSSGETMRLLCGGRAHRAAHVIVLLSEMRLLAQNPLRYRRQVFALKHFLGSRHATVLMIDDMTSRATISPLASCTASSLCGCWRPTMAQAATVVRDEMRGIKFRGGYHDYSVRTGG
jgi:circadian clock protein KaiC